EEEIQRMIREAEENAEADKKRKEEAELRNEADQLIFTVEKTVKDLEGKVDQSEVNKANDAKEKLQNAWKNNNIDEIRKAKDELSEIVQQLSVKLYEQAAQQAQAQNQNQDQNAGKNDDNVVDAEFEEVDDDKNK